MTSIAILVTSGYHAKGMSPDADPLGTVTLFTLIVAVESSAVGVTVQVAAVEATEALYCIVVLMKLGVNSEAPLAANVRFDKYADLTVFVTVMVYVSTILPSGEVTVIGMFVSPEPTLTWCGCPLVTTLLFTLITIPAAADGVTVTEATSVTLALYE